MWSVTTRPSTASPRNSSRSFDVVARVLGAPRPVGQRRREQASGRRTSCPSRLGAAPSRSRAGQAQDVSSQLGRRRSRRRRARSSGPRGPRRRCGSRRCARRAPPRGPRPARSGPASRRRGRRRTTAPSVMVDGSISRMSARRSRIELEDLLRSSGPCSTWVSAGTDAPGRADDVVVPDCIPAPDACALVNAGGARAVRRRRPRPRSCVDDGRAVHHLRAPPGWRSRSPGPTTSRG